MIDFPLAQAPVHLTPNREYPFIYDVELDPIEALKEYDAVECHIVLYPYSRKIRATDFTFNPFEEYVNDISTRRKSIYDRIPNPGRSIFGVLLGALIFLIFFAFKPSDALSLQSIVSILGVYFIGKDFWNEIEAGLINVTKTAWLRYQQSPYQYKLEPGTTLTQYFTYAWEYRYGKSAVLPDKIDFVETSNSKTARLYMDRATLANTGQSGVHVLSIRVSPELLDDFNQTGFMLGVKLSLNRKHWWGQDAHEFFQSLSKGERGMLDERSAWHADATLERRVSRMRNLRYLKGRRVLNNTHIIAADAPM